MNPCESFDCTSISIWLHQSENEEEVPETAFGDAFISVKIE